MKNISKTIAHRYSWKNILYVGLLAITACTRVVHDHNPNDYLVNVDKNGVILDGYDPVAFFTDNKPVKGSSKFQSRYNHALYYFASAEHKQTFDENPAKYEPQFGAYCAYAVSLGRTAPIDVNTFSIIQGRLVVQHNERAVSGWEKDANGNLAKADRYWPLVVKNNGKQIKTDEKDVPGNIQKADAKWPGLVKAHAGKPVKFDKPA